MAALPTGVAVGVIHIKIYPLVLDEYDQTELTEVSGKVIFTASPPFLTHSGAGMIIPPWPVVAFLEDGEADIVLMATDDPDVSPLNFTYKVQFQLEGTTIAPFHISVPSGSDRNLADIVPVQQSDGVYYTAGPQGPAGPAGPKGDPGSSSGSWQYKWKTGTTATDPAHGFIAANNAVDTAYTALYVSAYDGNGNALLALNSLSTGDNVYLYEAGAIGTWNRYTLTGTITRNGNPVEWATLPVTFAESGVDHFTPSNQQSVLFLVEETAKGGYRGDWSATTAYVINDLVSSSNALWAAATAHTNVIPALPGGASIGGADGGPGNYSMTGSLGVNVSQYAHPIKTNVAASIGGIQIVQHNATAPPANVEATFLPAAPSGTGFSPIAPPVTCAAPVAAGSNRYNYLFPVGTTINLSANTEYWLYMRAVGTTFVDLNGQTGYNFFVYTGVLQGPSTFYDWYRNDGGTWTNDHAGADRHTYMGVLTVPPTAWKRVATV
jgi:hypothetical protein